MRRAFNENEISNFLIDIIGQKGKFNQQKILESVYLLEIDNHLKEILPKTLSDHVYPFKYSSGVLSLVTDHAIYAQELLLHQDKVLDKLRDKVSAQIQKLKIQVDNIYYGKHKTGDIMSRNEKLTNTPKAEHQNSELIDRLIAAIKKTT